MSSEGAKVCCGGLTPEFHFFVATGGWSTPGPTTLLVVVVVVVVVVADTLCT